MNNVHTTLEILMQYDFKYVELEVPLLLQMYRRIWKSHSLFLCVYLKKYNS